MSIELQSLFAYLLHRNAVLRTFYRNISFISNNTIYSTRTNPPLRLFDPAKLERQSQYVTHLLQHHTYIRQSAPSLPVALVTFGGRRRQHLLNTFNARMFGERAMGVFQTRHPLNYAIHT